MKKTCVLTLLVVVAFASCNKTTNNTTQMNILPSFTVNGVEDIIFVNGATSIFSQMNITVAYDDSAQQTVALFLSPLPSGITMDTLWVNSGIPTYSTNIVLYDTTTSGATPGTYPMTLTARGSVSGTKTYSFNIRVQPQPTCTTNLLGKYQSCSSSCSSGGTYTDSVYADASVNNKIWFTNLNGGKISIYGQYHCSTGEITVPSQTAGGITYSGTGNGYYTIVGGTIRHTIDLLLTTSPGSGACNINMN